MGRVHGEIIAGEWRMSEGVGTRTKKTVLLMIAFGYPTLKRRADSSCAYCELDAEFQSAASAMLV